MKWNEDPHTLCSISWRGQLDSIWYLHNIQMRTEKCPLEANMQKKRHLLEMCVRLEQGEGISFGKMILWNNPKSSPEWDLSPPLQQKTNSDTSTKSPVLPDLVRLFSVNYEISLKINGPPQRRNIPSGSPQTKAN